MFKSNGTGLWIEEDNEESFKYTYTSNVIYIDFGDGELEEWEYSISGNILYMGFFDEEVFKLKKQ